MITVGGKFGKPPNAVHAQTKKLVGNIMKTVYPGAVYFANPYLIFIKTFSVLAIMVPPALALSPSYRSALMLNMCLDLLFLQMCIRGQSRAQ